MGRDVRAPLLLLALVLGVVSSGARASAPTGALLDGEPEEGTCSGVGKKTLSDRLAANVNIAAPVDTTVAALASLPVPTDAGPGWPRSAPVETTVWRMTVRLVFAKLQKDQDIHLVVADPAGSQTMITELPNPDCPGPSRSAERAEMVATRQALLSAVGPITGETKLLGGTAVITGVGFFDTVHSQHGVAPNGIELHPLLSFTLMAAEAPPTRPPAAAPPATPAQRLSLLVWKTERRGQLLAEQVRVQICAIPGRTYRVRIGERARKSGRTSSLFRTVSQTANCTSPTLRWRFPASMGRDRYTLTLTLALGSRSLSLSRSHEITLQRPNH